MLADEAGRVNKMHYVYCLRGIKRRKLYIGCTEDLKRRLHEHNTGRGGIYTSKNGPYELMYYEAYSSKIDAFKQEKFYKTGYGKEVLKGKLEETLK